MKRMFPALLLCTGIVFSACQKELSYEVDRGNTGGGGGSGSNGGGGNSGYYIKGKKDGAAFTFSGNALATIVDFTATLGAGVGLGLHASPDATSMEAINISIILSTGNTVPTGTYSETDNLNFTKITTGSYIVDNNLAYAAGVSLSPTPPLTVVIQSKTNTEISGTFQGAFYKSDGSGGVTSEHVTFTDCSFKLPIK